MGDIQGQIARLASDEVAAAWDEMDSAAQRIQTAQASQMTAAAERLEAARLRMRSAIQVALYARDVSETRPAKENEGHGRDER